MAYAQVMQACGIMIHLGLEADAAATSASHHFMQEHSQEHSQTCGIRPGCRLGRVSGLGSFSSQFCCLGTDGGKECAISLVPVTEAPIAP